MTINLNYTDSHGREFTYPVTPTTEDYAKFLAKTYGGEAATWERAVDVFNLDEQITEDYDFNNMLKEFLSEKYAEEAIASFEAWN